MTTEQRFTFDQIADLYDRHRPRYPERLFDDLISLSGIESSERILEIGSGTGQATLPLARLGLSLLCLEPGHHLAAIARAKLASYPAVEIRCETFENWNCEHRAFGLVISAQAFHWLLPELRFQKSADALRPGGSLAVVGNAVSTERSPHSDAGGWLSEALDAAYASHAPSIKGPSVTAWYASEGPVENLFNESGLFEEVVVRRYPWSHRYRTSDYLGLMDTHSDHRLLPPEQRQRLHQAIRQALERAGGEIEIFYEANLYLGRRAPARSFHDS